MKRSQTTVFYLEALLLILIFVAMILVLTGVFGAARTQSAEARRLTHAVTLASNAAEVVSASKSLEDAATLLDEGGNVRIVNGRIEAAYREDGTPCADEPCALLLTVTFEPSDADAALIDCRIAVYAPNREQPVYTLETARFGKEATA